MLYPGAKIRDDLFGRPEQKPTRDGFGMALMELGEKNKEVVVVCADLSESTRVLEFKEKYPERFFESAPGKDRQIQSGKQFKT